MPTEAPTLADRQIAAAVRHGRAAQMRRRSLPLTEAERREEREATRADYRRDCEVSE